MTYDRFTELEAYINHALPNDQRQALERQLTTDDGLRAELDDYQQFRFSIEAVALNQKLEQIHARLDRQGLLAEANPASVRRRWRLRPSWAMAMGVFLLVAGIGLYWATRPSLAEQTFVTYYKPEPVSRGESVCGPELAPGVQAYRTRHYAQAASSFATLPVNQPCVRYYRGLTQLALGHTDVAIAELEQATQQRPDSDKLATQKAQWYLALAYLKANRTANAQKQLADIEHETGHPFGNVARKALADLGHE